MSDDKTSTADKTPTPPPATVDGGNTDEIEDPDASSHDSKRRKICPKALDKIDDFIPPNRTFSFTFDTKFSACGSDATPKFGSFQSEKESTAAQSTAEDDLACEIPTEILEMKEEEEEEELGVLNVFEVVEGIELNDDDTEFGDKIGEGNLPV